VTVSLENVPWDQALEVVMTTLDLAAERNESVLRVMPRDMLLKQKQQDLDNAKLSQVSAPRITRVFPLSYASPPNIRDLLKQYSAPIGPTAGYAPPTILVDDNTQSLVIQDTSEGIEKAKKIIRLLDVQTPQVIIEAKVIDATEGFTRSLDGKFDLGLGGLTASINGGLAGAASSSSGGSSSAAGSSGGANTFKFGIGNTFSLNALLNYSEGDSKAKVISTPRVLVLSGKQAKITQGSNLAVKQTTMTNGQVVETTTFIPYNTSLNITPRATNDGSVLMKLDLSRDTVVIDQNGQSSVAPRNVTTEVIVDSGNTLVIGGVQSTSETEASGGFPFLRKLPLLGWLFGKETSITDKNELMFFVTPRILNVKKTSISDGSESEGKSSKL
jgi:type IV pilus assembly protein PilQ